MVGAVAIVVALLVFPVVFLMSMAPVAAALGSALFGRAEERFEGSELLDTNV